MMGWVYMATCVADFILFPILWNIVQAITHAPVSQWQPITLQANGFYHLTMCAVLGISAYGRTQEKLAGVENDPIKVTNGAEPVQSDSSTGNPE